MKNTVVYRVDCPDCDCIYIEERVLGHAGRDRNSHVYKHSLTTGNTDISMENVTLINKNFPNYYKRKVSEAIFIKQKRPILNIQIQNTKYPSEIT